MSTAPLALAPGVETLEIDGEVLVFDGEVIHLMEGSGAEIWRAVDGRRTPVEIVDDLVDRHAGAPGVEMDVRAFLDDLLSRGLVIWAASPQAPAFAVPAHVAWSIDGSSVTLLDLGAGNRQTLNPTASRVWVLLAGGLSLESTLTRLVEEFPDAPPSLAEDTQAFVDLLCSQHLLAPVP